MAQGGQDRWKEKYLTALEEQDHLEKNFNNRIDLLRRGLVRVSLAAEGLDPQLDKNLTELREILRGEELGAGVNRLIESLEKKILKLDKRKKDNAEKVHSGFVTLTDQLIKCSPPKDITKGLKRFKKDLKRRAEALSEYPNLVTELATLQDGALSAEVQEDAEKSGFWRKLLGMDSGEENAPKPDVGSVVDTSKGEASASGETNNLDNREESTEDAMELDVPETSVQEMVQEIQLSARHAAKQQMQEPGFATISEHVGVTLKGLIRQLDIPETEQPKASALEQRIRDGLNWYELVPALEDMVVIVLAALGEGQTEFEAFLTALNDQLSQFESYVQNAKLNQTQSDQNNAALNQAVREQVSVMQNTIADASDISSLKTTVQERLHSILASMDTFQTAETDRKTSLEDQMLTLIERVESMEQQSKSFHQHLEEQRKQSLTDTLTQLPNRAAYEETIRSEFARWKRYGHPFSLVVADIDFFKKVNDTYGHIAGDKVLKVVARTMKLEMRETDFIARYGGEEFVILMPETDETSAKVGAEKVRAAVEGCPFHFKEKRVPITVSLGITEFEQGDTIEKAFQRADKALYSAKESGRNRIVLFEKD